MLCELNDEEQDLLCLRYVADLSFIEGTPGTQVMWTNGDAVIFAIKLEQLNDAGALLNTENYELQPGGILTKVFTEPATDPIPAPKTWIGTARSQ